jgi:hypothetical protein
MRRLLFSAAAGLCLLPLAGLSLRGSELTGGPATPAVPSRPVVRPVPPAPPASAKEKKEGTGCHGTRIDFVDTPTEAAKIAKKEQKLVFVLHVSGNFEDPRFT